MVAVQPDTQIVEWIVDWLTAGLSAPGVSAGSGSPGNRSAGPAPRDGAGTPVALGANDAPAPAEVSSSASAADAIGEAAAIVSVATLADGLDVPPAPVCSGATDPDAQPAATKTTSKAAIAPTHHS